jgi:hypothetical protein
MHGERALGGMLAPCPTSVILCRCGSMLPPPGSSPGSCKGTEDGWKPRWFRRPAGSCHGRSRGTLTRCSSGTPAAGPASRPGMRRHSGVPCSTTSGCICGRGRGGSMMTGRYGTRNGRRRSSSGGRGAPRRGGSLELELTRSRLPRGGQLRTTRTDGRNLPHRRDRPDTPLTASRFGSARLHPGITTPVHCRSGPTVGLPVFEQFLAGVAAGPLLRPGEQRPGIDAACCAFTVDQSAAGSPLGGHIGVLEVFLTFHPPRAGPLHR